MYEHAQSRSSRARGTPANSARPTTADGRLATEGEPGGVTLKVVTDEAGQDTARSYTDSSGNVLLSDQAGYSGSGQQLTRALSMSGGAAQNDTYGYDAAGHLTTARETLVQ